MECFVKVFVKSLSKNFFKMDKIGLRSEKLLFARHSTVFLNFSSTYRNFIHQGLDLVDNLVSVGLVDVGAEGDLALLGVLRYGRHTEHLGRG